MVKKLDCEKTDAEKALEIGPGLVVHDGVVVIEGPGEGASSRVIAGVGLMIYLGAPKSTRAVMAALRELGVQDERLVREFELAEAEGRA